ncbi:MAG: hypothetical protein C4B59_07085 [Candidatus Methanogaster sp.]|uniref:Uncharacterized protein n=1 Tax=Candidatus Methanogaster sp. TaxID=3386292 RepID=A0AC61L3V3_9EURY|nr:MAG: hypothetical protein C4B59_07085 [ANME-2 cluster archaeon]
MIKILAVLVLATGISAASGIATIETTQLVNGTAWECAPVWDMDGGTLFYASNESGNFDIWKMDADGANNTQITNDTADEFPSFIWHGKVVYVSQFESSSIRIMDADGTNRSELSGDDYDIDPALVNVPVPRIFDMQPSGTIDNNVPAISANFSCSYGNISAVNLSVDEIDVTTTPHTNITDSNISYVPTEPLDCGDHNFTVEVKSDWHTVGYGLRDFTITYITNPQLQGTCNNRPTISANISVGYGDIETVTIYVDCVNVTPDATITDSCISYTPVEPLLNGTHNATVSVNSTYGINDSMNLVFCVNTCGGGGGGTYPPGWGSLLSQPKIVFASNRSGNFDLWIMNTDGTSVMQLTDSPSNETHPAAIYSKIVYVSDESGNNDLWSMDIDGSNRGQLTSSAADEYMPAESPIGGIVYASRSGSGDDYDLWAMNTDGTGKTRLTNNPSDELSPVFSPSLHQLKVAYALESDDSDIWTTSFEEIGCKVRVWRLGEGCALVCGGVDRYDDDDAWLDLNINGTRDSVVVTINESFSMPDPDNPIVTGTLHNISRFADSAFEVSLVNVTHYSIDGEVLFSNRTKILTSAPIHLDPMRGDLDGNGKITPTDAVIALGLAVTGEWCGDADMNDDKHVTALDALMILQAAARDVGKP